MSPPETLREAWTQVRANAGSAGVDGVTIEEIEREGEEGFLEKLVGGVRNARGARERSLRIRRW